MVPLSQLKVKAAKLCVNNGKRIKIDAADPNSQPPKLSRRNIQDQKKLSKIGETLIHKKINFDTLKPLRSYIKSFCKNIPVVKFYDIDFNFTVW